MKKRTNHARRVDWLAAEFKKCWGKAQQELIDMGCVQKDYFESPEWRKELAAVLPMFSFPAAADFVASCCGVEDMQNRFAELVDR